MSMKISLNLFIAMVFLASSCISHADRKPHVACDKEIFTQTGRLEIRITLYSYIHGDIAVPVDCPNIKLVVTYSKDVLGSNEFLSIGRKMIRAMETGSTPPTVLATAEIISFKHLKEPQGQIIIHQLKL